MEIIRLFSESMKNLKSSKFYEDIQKHLLEGSPFSYTLEDYNDFKLHLPLDLQDFLRNVITVLRTHEYTQADFNVFVQNPIKDYILVVLHYACNVQKEGYVTEALLAAQIYIRLSDPKLNSVFFNWNVHLTSFKTITSLSCSDQHMNLLKKTVYKFVDRCGSLDMKSFINIGKLLSHKLFTIQERFSTIEQLKPHHQIWYKSCTNLFKSANLFGKENTSFIEYCLLKDLLEVFLKPLHNSVNNIKQFIGTLLDDVKDDKVYIKALFACMGMNCYGQHEHFVSYLNDLNENNYRLVVSSISNSALCDELSKTQLHIFLRMLLNLPVHHEEDKTKMLFDTLMKKATEQCVSPDNYREFTRILAKVCYKSGQFIEERIHGVTVWHPHFIFELTLDLHNLRELNKRNSELNRNLLTILLCYVLQADTITSPSLVAKLVISLTQNMSPGFLGRLLDKLHEVYLKTTLCKITQMQMAILTVFERMALADEPVSELFAKHLYKSCLCPSNYKGIVVKPNVYSDMYLQGKFQYSLVFRKVASFETTDWMSIKSLMTQDLERNNTDFRVIAALIGPMTSLRLHELVLYCAQMKSRGYMRPGISCLFAELDKKLSGLVGQEVRQNLKEPLQNLHDELVEAFLIGDIELGAFGIAYALVTTVKKLVQQEQTISQLMSSIEARYHEELYEVLNLGQSENTFRTLIISGELVLVFRRILPPEFIARLEALLCDIDRNRDFYMVAEEPIYLAHCLLYSSLCFVDQSFVSKVLKCFLTCLSVASHDAEVTIGIIKAWYNLCTTITKEYTRLLNFILFKLDSVQEFGFASMLASAVFEMVRNEHVRMTSDQVFRTIVRLDWRGEFKNQVIRLIEDNDELFTRNLVPFLYYLSSYYTDEAFPVTNLVQMQLRVLAPKVSKDLIYLTIIRTLNTSAKSKVLNWIGDVLSRLLKSEDDQTVVPEHMIFLESCLEICANVGENIPDTSTEIEEVRAETDDNVKLQAVTFIKAIQLAKPNILVSKWNMGVDEQVVIRITLLLIKLFQKQATQPRLCSLKSHLRRSLCAWILSFQQFVYNQRHNSEMKAGFNFFLENST